MKNCSFLELSEKDVINLCTGEKLGRIHDLEINTKDSMVTSVIVPGHNGTWGLAKASEIMIPWRNIECIGEDTVLVRLTAEELGCCTVPKRKIKRNLFGK